MKDFYKAVTSENALAWFAMLPPHLTKQIEAQRATYAPGREARAADCPAVFAQVNKELGMRPNRPASPADPLDGHTKAQVEQWEAHKAWGARYDELLLIHLIVHAAPAMQRERKMMADVMGLDTSGLPTQAEGLDPTTAATVRWIQSTGETPIEYLAKIFRSDDPAIRVGDKINAAKTMMDFVHRRVPVKTETESKDISEPKLAPEVLKKLTGKDLENLERLLSLLAGNDK